VKRRIIAAVAAALSAAVGATLLLSYVAAADRRAMAGMETVSVLVATEDVPQGTSADALQPLVDVKTLPVVAVAPEAARSLTELTGLVAASEVKAGEQILTSRFADPATLAAADEPQVPKGMHEVTLRLDAQRVLGGELTPKATVGVLVSVGETLDEAQTRMILPAALVTRVGGGTAAPGDGESDGSTPAEAIDVTLALTPAAAEKVVFGAEHGTIWLSLATPGSTASGSRVVTGKNVYK
jgi:pilus assembly protein CpaB